MDNTTHSASRKVGRVVLCLLGAAAGAVVLTGSTCSVLNKAPSVPAISGPSAGVVGVPVTFKATATDPEGDSIAFQFDWGDSSALAWTNLIASGETTSLSHTYTDSGAYSVKARTRDRGGKESDLSGALALSLFSPGPAYPDSVYGSIYVRDILSCSISPDGTQLALGPGPASDSISIIRVSNRALLARVRADTCIGALAFSADNRYIFASSPMRGRTYRVDVTEGRVVDSVSGTGTTDGLQVTPDGRRLLACSFTSVYVLNAETLAIVDSVQLPYFELGMALNKAGTDLYVCTLHGVAVVDVSRCSVRAFSQAVDMPMNPVLSPDEESLYVYSGVDSGVTVLRPSDLAVTRRVSLHIKGVRSMKRTPDGAHIYLSYGGALILDTRTLLPVDSVVLPSWGPLAMHPNGDSVYCVGGSTVHVIGKRH